MGRHSPGALPLQEATVEITVVVEMIPDDLNEYIANTGITLA